MTTAEIAAPKIRWAAVLDEAIRIVNSYDTGVTLRQLFYQLVSKQLIPNKQTAYQHLSHLSAEMRREGTFPDLIDETRDIHRYAYWSGVDHALQDALDCYRLDRTAGQEVSIYLGVEKRGILAQLESWFGDLGTPVVPLGGYPSQSYVDRIARDVEARGRRAILVYAGDFDPSGEDIARDLIKRTGCWDEVKKIALSYEQVQAYGLPINPGKKDDTRASKFIEKYGSLMQVELDAIDPVELRRLYQEAIDEHWDPDAYEAALEREEDGRARLAKFIGAAGGAA